MLVVLRWRLNGSLVDGGLSGRGGHIVAVIMLVVLRWRLNGSLVDGGLSGRGGHIIAVIMLVVLRWRLNGSLVDGGLSERGGLIVSLIFVYVWCHAGRHVGSPGGRSGLIIIDMLLVALDPGQVAIESCNSLAEIPPMLLEVELSLLMALARYVPELLKHNILCRQLYRDRDSWL
jgi:hypothetical protein